MRWPRLKRRAPDQTAQLDHTNVFKPGSWAKSSLPPAEPDRSEISTGNVEVVRDPAPPTPQAPPTPPAAASPVAFQAPEENSDAGVQLGFADGSNVQLDPDHPHSLALRAVADVLLHRGPRRRQ